MLDGEGTDEKERNMRFSLSTPKEVAIGLKCIWGSKIGTSSSARIIKDVDLSLKVLEIVYCTNGASFEGLDDRNGHRRKMVNEGKKCQLGRCTD